MAEAGGALDSMRAERDAAAIRLQTEAQALTGLQERLKEAGRQVADLRDAITASNAERDEAREQLAKQEVAYREVSGRVDVARLSAKGALSVAAAANEENAKLKAGLASVTARAEALQRRVEELENALAFGDAPPCDDPARCLPARGPEDAR